MPENTENMKFSQLGLLLTSPLLFPLLSSLLSFPLSSPSLLSFLRFPTPKLENKIFIELEQARVVVFLGKIKLQISN